jgi:hypothetical protein
VCFFYLVHLLSWSFSPFGLNRWMRWYLEHRWQVFKIISTWAHVRILIDFFCI